RLERNLSPADHKAGLRDQRGDVAGGDRTVKLAALGGLAQHNEALAVKLLRDLFRFLLLLEIARFEFDSHVLETGAVLFGGTQRFAFAQERVPGKAVLDAHDIADLAKFGDTLK